MTLPILALVLSMVLAGCGQKGPLYREAPGAMEAAADASVDQSDERDSAADRDQSR